MGEPWSRHSVAEALDRARKHQHLSIRAAARLVGVPPATMQGWLSGRYGPTPALRPQFEALVHHLGLDDEVRLEWLDVRQTLGALRTAAAPYVGLRPYRADEEPLFFGRDAEARRVAEAVAASGPGLLALVAPSGAGKSSLLAAGLIGRHCGPDGVIDRTTAASWTVADLVAGTDPAPASLIVVDQFEDLLLLGDAQDAALDRLTDLARTHTIVLAVRSDAYGHLAELPPLREALEHPVLLQPLTPDEVREVIAGPAARIGVTVDPALIELIVADLAAESDHRTTQSLLPLVSHALLITWGTSAGNRMSVADYRLAGGSASAVENLADGIVSSLDDEEGHLIHRLFMRLVGLVDGRPTRRTVDLDSLPPEERAVAQPFVDARLLTVTSTTLHLSHDAVLKHWPRLVAWIEESRQQLQVREHLTRAATLWVDNDRDPAGLIPVDRLPLFAGLDPEGSGLSPVALEFLAESRAHFTNLLDAERRTSARLRRRGRLAVTLLAVTLALALLAGFASVRLRDLQLDAQSRQIANQANALREVDANLQAQLALVSHGLADTREGVDALMAATAQDVPTRWRGAASAFVTVGTDGTVARADGAGRVALWRDGDLAHAPDATFIADPAGGQLFAVAVGSSGGRTLLVTGGAGGYRALWDITSEPQQVATLGSGGTLFAASFLPTTDELVFAHSDGTASVLERWALDSDTPRQVTSASFPGQVSALAVLPRSDQVVTAGTPGHLDRWSLTGGGLEPVAPITLTSGALVRGLSLAVSPQGDRLAAGLSSGEVARWSLITGEPSPERTTATSTFWVNGVAFSPDGARLLSGDSEQRVHLWDAASMTPLHSYEAPAIVQSVAFVRDEPVATTVDGTTSAWRGASPLLRTGETRLYNLAADAAGRRWLAATNRTDVSVESWRLDADPPASHRLTLPTGKGSWYGTAMSPKGDRLVASNWEGEVMIWDTSDEEPRDPRLSVVSQGSPIIAMDISPDGSLFAAARYSGNGTVLARLGGDLSVTPIAEIPGEAPQHVTFSPDGRHLQVGLGAGQVQLWDVTDPEHPAKAGAVTTASNPGASAFSASGRLLATGTDAGEVQLWDWTDPAAPTLVRQLHGPRSGLNVVAFSPEGTWLVAAGADDTLWGWRLADADADPTFGVAAHMDVVNDIQFLDDGARMAATGSTGDVRVYDLSARNATDTLCARRGEGLTAEEWERYLPGIAPFDSCG